MNYSDLSKKYNQIRNDAKDHLRNNDIDIDEQLNSLENDQKSGVSLIVPLGNIFRQVIEKLKKADPEQYFYSEQDTHLTILTFLSATEKFELDQYSAQKYNQIISNVLSNVKPFKIKFKGITSSKGAVIAQVFVDDTLNNIREELREETKKENLPLTERYKIEIAHSTIMRFKKKLKDPVRFADLIEELRETDIDLFEVNKMLLVHHDWYNTANKTTILGEFTLKP